MKRIAGWLIVVASAVLVVRVLTVFSIQPQAYNSFVGLNDSDYTFEKVKIASINNTLTKYTASWKALDVLADTYEGHHMIEGAEYVAHNKTWYLVGRDISLEQFFKKVLDMPLVGSTYYVKLPDGQNYAYVLGLR